MASVQKDTNLTMVKNQSPKHFIWNMLTSLKLFKCYCIWSEKILTSGCIRTLFTVFHCYFADFMNRIVVEKCIMLCKFMQKVVQKC